MASDPSFDRLEIYFALGRFSLLNPSMRSTVLDLLTSKDVELSSEDAKLVLEGLERAAKQVADAEAVIKHKGLFEVTRYDAALHDFVSYHQHRVGDLDRIPSPRAPLQPKSPFGSVVTGGPRRRLPPLHDMAYLEDRINHIEEYLAGL
jgi:hypothetical protein